MKPEARTFSDSRESWKPIKIVRRKKERKKSSDGTGKWYLSHPKPWFHFYVPGTAAWRGQARTPTQSALHTGAFWGPRSRQTVVFNDRVSRTQLHQKSRGPFQLWFKKYSFQYRTPVSRRHHLPTLVFHMYIPVQIWKTACLSCHAYLHHSICGIILINETSLSNVIAPFPSPSDTFLYSLNSQLVIVYRRVNPIIFGAPNSPCTI